MNILGHIHIADDFIDRAVQARKDKDEEQESKLIQIAIENIRVAREKINNET